ncbi:Gfo/Idh/MocA family protein [Kribbella sindirgiensis]|uniref:Gfo/Idh/MocA family oxidoreductase n=1 Tax=Kribbella sindirgiensis TaxID=1124744 RepID=A0A4V2M1D3_9ACTN|nr:Gfo/Idh/MocA family oxidoreductase [Kribbella sindirgiensis]TCC15479.1 Gfo/Idh/MocA family oxidoreductase [Kribbella sindirgiensis]
MTVRIAIVGCGNISRRHAEAYANTGRTELVGVADIVEAKAQELAGKYGGTPYASVTELLAAEDPDLVSVTTPPGSHAEIAIEILAAGKSVLLEKPPVLSLAEMDAVAEAERVSAGSVWVIFQHRHGSGALRAADLLGRGALGRPLVAVCETLWFRPLSYFDPDWRGTWVGEGGGPTLGHGIHQIDLLLHLLGPWRTINATAVRLGRPVEFEDVSMASVIFESDAVGTVINSLLSPRELSRIRIDTSGGTLEVNHVYGYSDGDWTFHPAPDAAKAAALGIDPGVRKTAIESSVADDPWTASAGDDVPSNHEAQISRLIDDLQAGRSHETTLAGTRPTMEFVTALYASAITGRPVHRTDLTPDHPFYQALHGNTPKTELSESFRT